MKRYRYDVPITTKLKYFVFGFIAASVCWPALFIYGWQTTAIVALLGLGVWWGLESNDE